MRFNKHISYPTMNPCFGHRLKTLGLGALDSG